MSYIPDAGKFGLFLTLHLLITADWGLILAFELTLNTGEIRMSF